MRKRIPPAVRQRLNAQRIQTLQTASSYENRLVKLRTNEIKRVLKLCESVPVEKWTDQAPAMLEEAYLGKYYEQLYLSVGLPIASETINNFIGRKSADMWEDVIKDWLAANAGRKITLVNGSLKDWLRVQIEASLQDLTAPIEKMTGELYGKVLTQWSNVKEWQVRRIVQTEALTASSVAGFESVRALNMPFDKIWASSGLPNTRTAHAIEDGQTVDSNDPFIVDGELLMYPRDDSMGASAGNIINCACTHIAVPKNI